MVNCETLRRATREDYEPLSSTYLKEGYKNDDFQLTNVMVGKRIIIGSVKVNRFFPPMDGEFHLSAAMAMIWISQLGTVYSFLDTNVPKKDREIYLRYFSMKCRKRIVELNEILLEVEITSKAERDGKIHYRSKFDIDVGSFLGEASWFMSDQPFIK